jgi:hypothetical protein
VRLGWFLSSALLKVKITTGVVAFLGVEFQIVAAVGVAAAAAVVAVAAVAAEVVAAVEVAAKYLLRKHGGKTSAELKAK